MEVMCISPIITQERGKENDPRPQVGDRCVVTRQQYSPIYKATYYRLLGYGDNNWYLSDCFAILPSQDADAMQDQEKESIINIETPIS